MDGRAPGLLAVTGLWTGSPGVPGRQGRRKQTGPLGVLPKPGAQLTCAAGRLAVCLTAGPGLKFEHLWEGNGAGEVCVCTCVREVGVCVWGEYGSGCMCEGEVCVSVLMNGCEGGGEVGGSVY